MRLSEQGTAVCEYHWSKSKLQSLIISEMGALPEIRPALI